MPNFNRISNVYKNNSDFGFFIFLNGRRNYSFIRNNKINIFYLEVLIDRWNYGKFFPYSSILFSYFCRKLVIIHLCLIVYLFNYFIGLFIFACLYFPRYSFLFFTRIKMIAYPKFYFILFFIVRPRNFSKYRLFE